MCDGGVFIGSGSNCALDANGANFKGYVGLRGKFYANGGVDLTNAKIDGNLDCDDGMFINIDGESAVDASYAEISGTVNFANFIWGGRIAFKGAQLGRQFLWSGAAPAFLPRKQDKSRNEAARANKAKSSSEPKFPDIAVLDLRLATVETLSNPKDSWPDNKKLSVDGFVYQRLHDRVSDAKFQLDWLDRQDKHLSTDQSKYQSRDWFRPQPFEQLAKVLREMGLEEGARTVLIAKNDQHRLYLRPPATHEPFVWINFVFEWCWYNAFGRMISYGYRPWNAFVLSLFVIALGWFFFWWGDKAQLFSPTDDKAFVVKDGARRLKKDKTPLISNDYPKFNAFVYSLETFVPLVKLGLAEKWVPNANLGEKIGVHPFGFPSNYGSLLRDYLWVHIIFGWGLTTLWVAGLSGLAKT